MRKNAGTQKRYKLLVRAAAEYLDSVGKITEWQNKMILFHQHGLDLLGEAEYDSACHSRKKTHQRIDSC